MTDHAAEQEMEMEALHAILMDDIEEYDGSHPAGWEAAADGRPSWRVAIHPPDAENEGGGDGDGADAATDAADELKLDLVFAHVPVYPDEPPLFRLRAVKGLSDADVEAATRAVREQVDACAGAAMVYNMVTAAQEWLGARIALARDGAGGGAGGGGDDPVAARRRAEAEEEARRAAARAHGTPVTRETFAAWQKAFEAEMAQKRGGGAGAAAAAPAGGADGGGGGKGGQQQQQQQQMQDKPTGKQWFLQAAAAAKDGEAVDDGSPELADDEEGDDYVRTDHGDDDEEEDFDDDDPDEDDEGDEDDDDDDDDDALLEFAIKRVAG